MLKKALRLARKDIESLSSGKSVFGTLLSIRVAPAPRLRFAVTASKKVAARAVDRNALRRRGYKALESVMSAVTKPASVMIMPKKDCIQAPIEAVSAEILSLLKKAGLAA
jgi:ribonuclease P protein component